MTLKNALKQYRGQMVKIGAENGSAFFYCGTAPDEEYMAQFSDRYYLRSSRLLKKRNGQIVRLEALEKPATAQMQRLKWFRCSREKAKTYLDHFVDMLDREVLECFGSVLEDEGTVILVSGTEQGKYWVVNEYKEAHKCS